MTDHEILCRAKTYIDKLANGIDPLTDEPVRENDIVNNVRISRCLFYVSGVLDKVISGDIPAKKPRTSKLPFRIPEEKLAEFEYSDTPIPITQLLKNVNAMIDENAMKKLSYKTVQEWLVKCGILKDAEGRYGRSKFCPTELGERMEIIMDERVDSQGTIYYVTCYSRRAQEFIVSRLSEIAQFKEENKK